MRESMESTRIGRRRFVGRAVESGAALVLGEAAFAAPLPARPGEERAAKRVRTAVIGCGSVSNAYLPELRSSPWVELVGTCDIVPERAERQARSFGVPNHYPHIDQLLAGAPFDLLVNLTDMQAHERLNRQALAAGKHVWSEKPLASSLAGGRALLELARERGVRIWGAPIVVASPQFAFMAKALAARRLGRVAAAHAAYGHTGPDWSAFFYEEGGGSMPDLGVYNLTTITGLLGPARAVLAMTSVVTPERAIRGKGTIAVTAEDNAMIILDHGGGVLSHVQCGFNYFNPHGHDGSREGRHTISIWGTEGHMGLVGHDWEPHGVDLATREHGEPERHAAGPGGYLWQRGASLVAECLATGKEPLFTPEHALHVVEIMEAARASQKTGRRVELESTFRWPLAA
jgi:predicted dehydrogenase